MIRSYTWADFLTIGNASCGTIAIFLCLDYLATGTPRFLWTAFILLPTALVCDVLDGYVARLSPRRQSRLGADLDSLSDVISFGVAPAILSFAWGLSSLGRLGWATGFLFVTAAAMRLARFNIQSASGGDKRYFVGMPSPAAAAIPAATVYAYPAGLFEREQALLALPMVIVPALLMVSTIRFRSFKTINLQMRRPYTVLLLIAVGIMLIATHAQAVLVAMAYTYLASAFIGMAINRFRRREGKPAEEGVRKEDMRDAG